MALYFSYTVVKNDNDSCRTVYMKKQKKEVTWVAQGKISGNQNLNLDHL